MPCDLPRLLSLENNTLVLKTESGECFVYENFNLALLHRDGSFIIYINDGVVYYNLVSPSASNAIDCKDLCVFNVKNLIVICSMKKFDRACDGNELDFVKSMCKFFWQLKILT